MDGMAVTTPRAWERKASWAIWGRKGVMAAKVRTEL